MLESLLPNYTTILEVLPDLKAVTNLLISLAPLYTYGTACYGIYKKKTSVGFSIDICATMIMSSILKIFYYFISPYENSLLNQAIVMVAIQCVLLKVSLKFRPVNYNPDSLKPLPNVFENIADAPRLNFSSNQYDNPQFYSIFFHVCLAYLRAYAIFLVKPFDVYYKRPFLFWQWIEERRYWKFIQYFVLFFSVLTLVLQKSAWFNSFLGTLGLFIEALLPLPQILILMRLRSVQNFKSILLISWLGGDCMKLGYLLYGTNNISLVFIVAALFQMLLDLVILAQYVYFARQDSKDNAQTIPRYEMSALPSSH